MTTTTMLVTTTLFTTTTTLPGDATFACQRAIENGGMEYVEQLLQVIEGCAAPGQTVPLRECLSSPPVRLDLGPTRDQWMATVGQACGVTSLRHDLGYLETCAAPPSACSSTIGDSSSLIECLACRIDEILVEVGVALFADQPVTGECHRALGTSGMHALRAILQQLHSCLQQPEATSIAACFTPELTPWRGDAETACAGMDPFSAPGYGPLCAGIEPVRPPACAGTAPPCAFPRTAVLSVPSEGNDLLDCLACRLEEAALAVGRTLHGAELCCTSEGCRTILSRAACHRAGGAPAHYELGSVDVGNIASPHGIAGAACAR